MSLTTNCDTCGTWRGTPGRCKQVACMACGIEQCASYGLARGCCYHCYFGRLPGWSFSHIGYTCRKKGCQEPAVYAYLPGSIKSACKRHGEEILMRRRIRQGLATMAKAER